MLPADLTQVKMENSPQGAVPAAARHRLAARRPHHTMPNAPTVTLRTAVPDDALCLGVLGTQVFLDTYATAGIRPLLAREVLAAFSTEATAALIVRERTVVRLAEFDGHLIGFAATVIGAAHELVPSDAPAELDKLYVQECYTGLGIGARLLHDAELQAAAAGARTLWLTPWAGNLRAMHFYRRQGYTDVGLTWFHIEHEAHANRVYLKALPHPRPA